MVKVFSEGILTEHTAIFEKQLLMRILCGNTKVVTSQTYIAFFPTIP